MNLADKIAGWIKDKASQANAGGVVLGISGGLDSAVVAALSKKAVGENVLGIIMPCHTNPEDEKFAQTLVENLNVKTLRVDLTPVYDTLVKLLPQDGKMALANLKPRLRMTTLYYLANMHNYIVAGTGNKSEITAGYFTKYGDGGVDILPIGNLLKTEVRKLAKELGIPEEIIKRPPTAGLWEGQTDEGELGITYDELDKTIKAIESGKTRKFNKEVLIKVKGLIEKSRHKKTLPPAFKP